MQWILVCNSNVFDLKGALKENNVIDWPQVDNVVVGDIVYFYMSLPYDSILFKCQVESVNRHRMEESTKKYIKHPLFYDNRQTYMQLRLLETYPEALIKGKDIIEKGFHNLQMSSRVSDEFSKYVDKKKREIGGFNKKSIKWLIGSGILLTVTILFWVFLFKTEPAAKPDIMINQSLLKYSNMTHAEFSKETGIKATRFHTYMYTAQIPYKDVEIVFGATMYDDAIYYLKDSDKCFRLEGQIGALLDGIEGKMTIEEFTNSLSWNGEKVQYTLEEGGGTVYYVSSEYAAVLFDSDGNGETDALLNIDMYGNDTISKDSYAWLFMGVEDVELQSKEDEFEIENFDKEIFEPGNQKGSSVTEDTQSAENQLVCDMFTWADYSENLNSEEYICYRSTLNREFYFYYPPKLYNKAELSKNINGDPYGIILENISFYGSDKESAANYQLIRRETGRTRVEDTQLLYDSYEQNMIGFQKVIFHDGADERPGRMIVIGYTDSSQTVMTYLLVQITDKHIMRMEINFPTDGNRNSEDFWQKEYVVECMYRLCGFSGSSKMPQTYQEFYDAKQTAKNVSDSTIAIKSDLRKYQNMTYSQYKEMTGAEVQGSRENMYRGDIPNTNLSIVFRGSHYEWDDGPVYQLQEHDLCYRLEGTLGYFLENIVGEMTIEDLTNALSKGTIGAKIQYGTGYAGGYSLSESWAVITFDSNQDGQYDTELHVDIMEKNTVNSETLAWIVFDLRDNNTEVLGWEE